MLYDEATMTELFTSLNTNYGKLLQQADDLQTAAGQLATAWEGNDGLAGFQSSKTKWDGEYEDTTTLLNRIAAEVENALQRALGTDGKVGDGFGY
ncbi:type VII secretion protein EsxR [Nocardia sp. NPDC050697]|uniref:WXG100 family type VII secretion target n=1 Tax=Nocardia sp. NPDC050697 TaxID=3155158 RepID=UPI0033C3E4D1